MNNFYRMYNKNKKYTKHFTKIPYKSKLLPVLITNSKVRYKEDILNKRDILFYLNDDKKIKKIKLNDNRKIHRNIKTIF